MQRVSSSVVLRRRPQDAVSYSILCDYVISTNVSVVPFKVLRSCGDSHELLDYETATSLGLSVVKATPERADYYVIWQEDDDEEESTENQCVKIILPVGARYSREYPIKLINESGDTLAYANIVSMDAVSYSILCDNVISTNVSEVNIQVLRTCGSTNEILDYDAQQSYGVEVVTATLSPLYSIEWEEEIVDGEAVKIRQYVKIQLSAGGDNDGHEYPIKLVDAEGTMLAYTNIMSIRRTTQEDIDKLKQEVTPSAGEDYFTKEEIEDLTSSVKNEVLDDMATSSEEGLTICGVKFKNGKIIIGQGNNGVILSQGGIDVFKEVTNGMISSQQQVSLNSTGMCGGTVSTTCSETSSGETDCGEESEPGGGTDEEDTGGSGIKDPNADNGLTHSDMRLKDVVSDIELTSKEIADAPIFDFKLKGEEVIRSGSSAQYWQQLLPHIIKEGADGMLSMQYAQAALIAVVSLAREVEVLKNEINELKNK